MKVWFDFFGPIDPQLRGKITQRLRAIHSPLLARDGAPPDTPGILLFSEVSPELIDHLRQLTISSVSRVAAVACSNSVLANADVWQLLQAGASDVFAWNHSKTTGDEILARFSRWQIVDNIVRSPVVRNSLVGQSQVWISILRQVVEVARFTDAPILILGESGSGKELIARMIHALDERDGKRELVVLDCTTVVPELSGSEFFGHERGAFTGAVTARDGAFALADRGTLFLDEVGELPLRLQAELLRVVQEQTYKRVGSNVWQQTRFRLVCATNRDLLEAQSKGRFRADFYSRIAGWTLRVPPLRERPEDILPLVRHFIEKIAPIRKAVDIDEPVRAFLLDREYRANVRDLKQLVSRIMQRHVGPGPITVGDIPEEERPTQNLSATWRDVVFESRIRAALAQGLHLKDIGRAAKETAERIVLAEEDGNLKRAAQKLGISDRALQMRRAARRVRVAASGH